MTQRVLAVVALLVAIAYPLAFAFNAAELGVQLRGRHPGVAGDAPDGARRA